MNVRAKNRFGGKVAIVTGAASGIGLATAKRLASEGASVVIADLDRDKAEAAARELHDLGAGRALAVACDVSKQVDVAAAVERTLAEWQRLDVVVNNAGRMVFKSIEEHTEADWMSVLHVDLLGAFFFIREGFRVMREGGAIVNVASIHAVETTPLVASYAAAKAAVLSLTRSAALEGKPKKIRVNAVLPGAIDTPMLWTNPNVRSGAEHVDSRDVGKAEDVAGAIAYLASPDAAFVQGAMLRVDGGRLDRL